jgi:hypothetical protein
MEGWTMKILTNLLTLLMVFALNSSMATAGSNKQGLVNQQSQTAFSARQYCRSSGGQVTETANQNIYLCCYKNKHKCIVSDTGKTVSWTIPYEGQAWTPAQIKAQLLQLLDGTDTFPGTETLAWSVRDGQ